jgi:hypothetical protein
VQQSVKAVASADIGDLAGWIVAGLDVAVVLGVAVEAAEGGDEVFPSASAVRAFRRVTTLALRCRRVGGSPMGSAH